MNEQHLQILKQHKLSVTSLRLTVLEAIDQYPHADADAIFKAVKERISTTSIQAIYHNLKTLVDHGIVREIKPKGKPSLYERRIGDNHHHLVCRKCGAIEDTDCFASAPCLSPQQNHGFAVDEAEVIFWGVCPSCQNDQTDKGKYDE